jgi:hypothetical protein
MQMTMKNKAMQKRRRSKEKEMVGEMILIKDVLNSAIPLMLALNARIPPIPSMSTIVRYKAKKNQFNDQVEHTLKCSNGLVH